MKLAQATAPQQTSSSPAIDRRFDELEQRSRMNQIPINGVKTEIPKGTPTDHLVCKIGAEIGVKIEPRDIVRSHFNSKPDPDRGRQIIVRLQRHCDKVQFLQNRKKLRDSGTFKSIFTHEDLTRKRYAFLSALLSSRKEKKLHSVWSFDGSIYYKLCEHDRPTRIDDIFSFDASKIHIME